MEGMDAEAGTGRREAPGVERDPAPSDDLVEDRPTLSASFEDFYEIEHGSLYTPALTTVHIDAEVLGRIAARNALGIDIGALAPVPGWIVVRASA